MPMLDHLWIILALPLAGSAINGLFGKNWPKSAVNSVAIGSVSLAFLAVAGDGSRISPAPCEPDSMGENLFPVDDRRGISKSISHCKWISSPS